MNQDLFGITRSPGYVRGSDTSEAAAASVAPDAATLRAMVFGAIKRSGPIGKTCAEIEDQLGMRHQTASARIRELVLSGYLVDSGQRRKTPSNRDAAAWVVSTTAPASLVVLKLPREKTDRDNPETLQERTPSEILDWLRRIMARGQLGEAGDALRAALEILNQQRDALESVLKAVKKGDLIIKPEAESVMMRVREAIE